MIDFGLDPTGRSKPVLLRDLAQYLVDQRLAGRMVLLVIDEAQNLSLAALEELRMLSNLETEKSKLLQITMVGQPNLREKLAAPELEQLRQRVTVSYHLQPLDADETANYINHRLRRAALGTPLEFSREVTDEVHARSRGVPRVVNVICDAALVFGYAEERRQVDLPLIHDVLAELEVTGVLPSPSRTPAAPAVAQAATVMPRIERGESRPVLAAPQGDGRRAELMDVYRPEAADHRPAARSPVGDEDERLLRAEAAARAAMDARLSQREAVIRQRERELAEQRRILAEEYRLLRSQRAAATTTAGVAAGSGALRVHVPGDMSTVAARSDRGGPAATRFAAARHDGFWAWLKRVLFGTSQPAVEEN
jgi:hypothetical protein